MTPLYSTSHDDRYFLYQARRLTRDNGEFNGIVVARISPKVFERALQRLASPRARAIALVDGELKLIARLPALDDPLPSGWQVDSPETMAMIEQGAENWSLQLTSPLDQRERLFQMQWIEALPLLVVVGEDLQLQLASWRQRAVISGRVHGGDCPAGCLGGASLFESAAGRAPSCIREKLNCGYRRRRFKRTWGMLIADDKGRILKVNDTFTRITGYSEDDVVGRSTRMLNSGRHDAAFYRKIWRRVQANGSWKARYGTGARTAMYFPSG